MAWWREIFYDNIVITSTTDLCRILAQLKCLNHVVAEFDDDDRHNIPERLNLVQQIQSFGFVSHNQKEQFAIKEIISILRMQDLTND